MQRISTYHKVLVVISKRPMDEMNFPPTIFIENLLFIDKVLHLSFFLNAIFKKHSRGGDEFGNNNNNNDSSSS